MATTSNDGSSSTLTQATVGWLDLLKTAQKMEKKYKKEMEKLRRQMTRNYKLVTAQIEKENEKNEEKRKNDDEEVAKNWISKNLEEAQLFIDRTVGIKGVTEHFPKAATQLERQDKDYWENVLAANTQGTLQVQVLEDAVCQSSHRYPLPRVSISSSIVPSINDDELYGY